MTVDDPTGSMGVHVVYFLEVTHIFDYTQFFCKDLQSMLGTGPAEGGSLSTHRWHETNHSCCLAFHQNWALFVDCAPSCPILLCFPTCSALATT